MSLLWIYREEKTQKMLLMRSKFVFLYADSFLYQNVSLLRGIVLQKTVFVYTYFCGKDKNLLVIIL